jgi:hypothetical protein
MWHRNQVVTRTFTTFDSENCWAVVEGMGNRKVKTGNKDGVTNVFVLLTCAKANDRTVDLYIVDDVIERAYLN